MKRNSQTTGLKNFWSYPVTLYSNLSKYLVISSDGTAESSEWQVYLSRSTLLTSGLYFAVKLVMCPLFWRWPCICVISRFTFEYAFLAHLSRRLKVSFCDHSPSVVVVVVVRLSVRSHVNDDVVVRLNVRSQSFKHLLLNHWLDFDQTSQEWSLVGSLSKLFKWYGPLHI